jgi:hypothetical protein
VERNIIRGTSEPFLFTFQHRFSRGARSVSSKVPVEQSSRGLKGWPFPACATSKGAWCTQCLNESVTDESMRFHRVRDPESLLPLVSTRLFGDLIAEGC